MMKMINATRVDTNNPNDHECRVCGRGVSDRSAWWIHVVDGGSTIAPIEDPDTEDPSDTGWHPVGQYCARRIPRTHRKKELR